MFKSALVVAALGLLVSSQACAAEITRSANSGAETLIRRYFSWNPDCSFKPIVVIVATRPLHGKLEPMFGDHVLDSADVRSGSIGVCQGRKIRVVELHYTSARGFFGIDRFSVKVLAPGLPTISDDYKVDVR